MEKQTHTRLFKEIERFRDMKTLTGYFIDRKLAFQLELSYTSDFRYSFGSLYSSVYRFPTYGMNRTFPIVHKFNKIKYWMESMLETKDGKK